MPPVPDEGDDEAAIRYVPDTGDEHMVAHWANVPITEVSGMPVLDYFRYRRDVFIFNMNQSEEGRKKLEKAWSLSQEKPDRQAARELFG